jgi:thioredoxin-like negative regulator of GroEL
MFQLGMNAIARGNTTEATQLLEQAYALAPDYNEAATLYALALISGGKIEEAEPIVQNVAGSGKYMPDQRILSAYVSQKRYDKVAVLMKTFVENHPADIKARVTEAAALYASGDKEGAVKSLEETQKVAPQQAAAAATLIQQVRAGTWNVQ